jgi:hypothetical protein
VTILAGVVTGVATGLARDAQRLGQGGSRAVLLGLFLFLALEWLAHFLGSRVERVRHARSDRAAWAALSSAGIWIAMLALVPLVFRGTGLSPLGLVGILVLTVAAGTGMLARLWFLREIYEIGLERAASLWTATRGAAIVLVFVAAVALYALSDAESAGALPILSITP